MLTQPATIRRWIEAFGELAGFCGRVLGGVLGGRVFRFFGETLRQAGEAAGLQVTMLKPVNLLGGLAWWAAVRMGGRGRPTPTLVKLYDRVIVPLVRVSERRFDPPFGQSVLCVARVPEQ